VITDLGVAVDRSKTDWPHSHCFVCSSANRCGLKLRFILAGDGGVAATFCCSRDREGYEGVVHGGVVSSILDGAMTNCLFAQDVVAWTAELTVRFRKPLAIDTPATVSAKVVRSDSPLYVVQAMIVQGKTLCATARGKFLEKAGLPASSCV
jgi:uncharacterized protein (TIGR00369 family)